MSRRRPPRRDSGAQAGDRRGRAQPAPLQTATRLGGLRVRITLLLIALNVVGLAGMGAVAMTVDQRQRDGLVAAELDRSARTTKALLYYDSGALQLDRLFADPAAKEPTAVYVYEGTRSDVRLVFAYPSSLPVIAPAALRGPARTVWRDGREYGATVPAGGRLARLLVVPFPHAVTGSAAGAIVVAVDLGARYSRPMAGWVGPCSPAGRCSPCSPAWAATCWRGAVPSRRWMRSASRNGSSPTRRTSCAPR